MTILEWKSVFEVLTLLFASAMGVIGLGSQIRKMYLEKKCGITLWIIALALAVYFCRSGYLLLSGPTLILIPDIIGFFFSAVMLFQYFRYSRN